MVLEIADAGIELGGFSVSCVAKTLVQQAEPNKMLLSGLVKLALFDQ